MSPSFASDMAASDCHYCRGSGIIRKVSVKRNGKTNARYVYCTHIVESPYGEELISPRRKLAIIATATILVWATVLGLFEMAQAVLRALS